MSKTSVRSHPTVAPVRAAREALHERGTELAGQAFADERGWLSAEERQAFATDQDRWPWDVAAVVAMEDRLHLDHPERFAAWIREEIALARKAGRPIDRWQTLRDRNPRYRVDEVLGVPRGDLYELEQSVTFRVTAVPSGDCVFEAHGHRSATYEGTWQEGLSEGAVAVRVEGHTAFVRRSDGTVTQHALPGSERKG